MYHVKHSNNVPKTGIEPVHACKIIFVERVIVRDKLFKKFPLLPKKSALPIELFRHIYKSAIRVDIAIF